MKTTLYGIHNCDTVKKAQRWLKQKAIDVAFHDFRKDGLTAEQVERWQSQLDMKTFINTRSPSWRGLDAADQQKILTGQGVDVILATPTLIKRPLLEHTSGIHVGFKPETYAALFNE